MYVSEIVKTELCLSVFWQKCLVQIITANGATQLTRMVCFVCCYVALDGVLLPPLRVTGRGTTSAGPQSDSISPATANTTTFTDCNDTDS